MLSHKGGAKNQYLREKNMRKKGSKRSDALFMPVSHPKYTKQKLKKKS